MPARPKYSPELTERATRMALDLRKDPQTKTGAIRRVGEQLGSTPRRCATGCARPRLMALFHLRAVDLGQEPGRVPIDLGHVAAVAQH